MKNNNRRIPLWFPYTSAIEVKKDKITFHYKGGVYSADVKNILSIMLYGGTCDLKEDFLQLCTKYSVPVCIHRRTMSTAIWITPSIKTSSKEDILSKQILFRGNEKKREHIARKLLKAKFKSMSWLTPYPVEFNNKRHRVKEMINIEAQHAKVYWKKYYELLGYKGYSRRGKLNILKSTLDAVSKLISGVVLRYIIYHRMSPYHGFLHVPTDYPSLVYDLMEPYRGYIEKIVFNAIKEARDSGVDEQDFLARCILAVEDYLDENIYTDATRQIVTFQELLHGVILSLRSYLQGESHKFIVPIPGKPNGGRPVKTGYKLYGRSAGPTDFWEKAEDSSKKHEMTLKI
ncbi:MAG: CRISPR-associated endonuclease Cas1 [Candidatus Vogelbacteria bacterium CG10_big_fil_rev_8_21_14_0_10_49_38]|uniref:CRISPR-associated endonuclease Cas1 n=1 Tax=Candidatus Vogelbacteria bacterium CG10_big_fil_rev_8_21_14_0_10_49_38 TaxID=1975043 RepID=A0A2H0RI68_9BACT|nr:MAG: CRISPR-associated endonuclease Cas1 [bacterium CG10_49_38]PIR46147.1 MAG: CRISPR-associated endonuclease Cas1 [Candidatus Vogelbacteria bacterium CG10_big_fil_rev_8_21_14_0_10_49_38]